MNYFPPTDYEIILRRTLAEKILLKLIEITPQMMKLDGVGPLSADCPRLSKLAWEFADAFLRAENAP
jgi:hypothetical protein